MAMEDSFLPLPTIACDRPRWMSQTLLVTTTTTTTSTSTPGRVTYAGSIYDNTLDRSYEYDNVGRLVIAHSGAESAGACLDGPVGNDGMGHTRRATSLTLGKRDAQVMAGVAKVQGGGAGQSSEYLL